MKNIIAAKWVFATTLVFVSIMMIGRADAQMIDRNLSLSSLSQSLRSPEDIAHYIWRHFSFETDRAQFGREEYWQTPEELLATGKGDCEDFAFFANQILKMKGVSSFLFNVYGNNFAHTVCVIKDGASYSVIDGTQVFRVESRDLKKVAGRVYPFWKKAAIVAKSRSSHNASVLAEFEKKLQVHKNLYASA